MKRQKKKPRLYSDKSPYITLYNETTIYFE